MSRFRLYALFYILTSGFNCLGQNAKIDSLQRILKDQREDTSKVKILNSICKQLWMTGDFYPSLGFAQKALLLGEKLNYTNGLAVTYNNFGIINGNVGNYPEALKYFLGELKFYEKISYQKGIADAYGNIGLLYNYMGNYHEAVKNTFAALAMEDQIGDKEGVALSYTNIGLIYFGRNNFKEALKNHQLSLKKSIEINNKYHMAGAYNNIGLVYEKLAEFDSALANHLQSLQIEKLIHDKQGVASSYVNISYCLTQKKKFSESRVYLNNGLKIANEIGDKYCLQEIYNGLAMIDSIEGYYQSYYENYKSYISYKDGLSNEKGTKKTVQTQMQYDFDKKLTADSIKTAEQAKHEELKHRQNIQQQKTYMFGGSAGFLLMLLLAGISFRAYKQKQKANAIITAQKHLVEEKQKEILDSIYYARRIQTALLPTTKYIEKNLKTLSDK